MTRRALLFIALALFWASPAAAQSEPAYRVSLAAAITAHGADLSTTAWCRGAGTCREVNPALRWAQDDAVALGLTKMGLAAGLALASHKWIKPRSRRAAFWFNVGQAVAFTAIAVRNARTTREPPR